MSYTILAQSTNESTSNCIRDLENALDFNSHNKVENVILNELRTKLNNPSVSRAAIFLTYPNPVVLFYGDGGHNVFRMIRKSMESQKCRTWFDDISMEYSRKAHS